MLAKKRFNILTQSMNTIKGLIKHENELFTNIQRPNQNDDINKINENVESQNNAFKSLLAVGQMYPDIKSSSTFVTFQNQISDENEHFSATKRAFNSNVSLFNQIIVSFPSSIVASILGKNK